MEQQQTAGAPQTSRFRTIDLVYIALMAVLITVCAWISIPSAVPFTLQTMAVFLAPSLLGAKRGFFAVLVYILLGAVGLPVFAGFKGGIGALLGSTGGYIVGFLVLVLFYWLVTAKLGEKLPVQIAALAIGLLLCYAFGSAWFMIVYLKTTGPVGLMTVLGWCVFPFLLPDAVKLALALLLARRLRPHLKLDTHKNL